jgi:hypothetical protein
MKRAKTKQVETVGCTVEWIMSRPEFALGVADARAGRPIRKAHDTWADINAQWNYSRGRQWAVLAPRNVPLKRNGKVTDEAIRWFGSNNII